MIPYTVDRRSDTGVTNVTMAIWLFLASEVMLFGSLFSAYTLLRVSATTWNAAPFSLDLTLPLLNTVVLIGATAAMWRARASAQTSGRWLVISALLAVAFLGVKNLEYRTEIGSGMLPSISTFIAMYFTLTGLHALHVAGGAIANLWAWRSARRIDARLLEGRVRALSLYWTFVDCVWLIILALVYFA